MGATSILGLILGDKGTRREITVRRMNLSDESDMIESFATQFSGIEVFTSGWSNSNQLLIPLKDRRAQKLDKT